MENALFLLNNKQSLGGFMRKLHNASFFILLAVVILVTACASVPRYKELVPQHSVSSSHTIPHFNGTVEVRSIIKPERMGFDIRNDLPIQAYVDDIMLETALIESVANTALFTRVEQKKADYVLDVWVDYVESYQPLFGIGDYGARVFSIWRLTRVSDGKVLVCDFVDGKGLINTMVSAPRTKSLVAALKDMIQTGLRSLADTSNKRFSANSVARIRPSMGSAVPEGLRAWEDKVKKNWSNLRKDLSLEEVENIIGPVRTSGALERIYQKIKRIDPNIINTLTYVDKDMGATITLDKEHILLNKYALTYYDEDMGIAILIDPPQRCKTFPYYDEHSYIYDKNHPNCSPRFDRISTRKTMGNTLYFMTHLYVLKFYRFEGLQTWVLR